MWSDCQQKLELCLITQFVLTRGDLTSFNFCFDEMKGDIIEVDYSKTNNLQKSNSSLYIETFYGYVDDTYRKGGESADGQSSGNPESEQAWTPKDKESKRFLGNPEKLKEHFNFHKNYL